MCLFRLFLLTLPEKGERTQQGRFSALPCWGWGGGGSVFFDNDDDSLVKFGNSLACYKAHFPNLIMVWKHCEWSCWGQLTYVVFGDEAQEIVVTVQGRDGVQKPLHEIHHVLRTEDTWKKSE